MSGIGPHRWNVVSLAGAVDAPREEKNRLMGDSPISLDLGSLASYAEDRLRHWFGKDEETEAWNKQFKKRWQNALEQGRSVQCIGMHRPVPIEQIYQPVAVYRAAPEWQQRASATPIAIEDLVLRGTYTPEKPTQSEIE
jgi:hypothetical protein